MKKGNIVFLAGLLACSVAGVATASAMIARKASITPIQGTTDTVLILNWGSDMDIEQISELKAGEPEFKRISVMAPQKSPSVTSKGLFTAQLSAEQDEVVGENKTASINGLSVLIYDAPFDDHGLPTGTDDNKIGELKTGSLTATDEVEVAKTYYFKIEISAEAYAQYADPECQYELAAKIHLTYGESNA